MNFNRREATAIFAAALFSTSARAQATTSKVLKVSAHASLRLLDPWLTTAYITRNHGYMIYDTLFAIDSGYRPKPQMVKAWQKSDDSLEYTFELRDGLVFHDGVAVTAEDCVSSLSRWMKRDLTGGLVQSVTESLVAVDQKTFKLKLKSPFGPLLEAFAKPSSLPLFIMPKRVADTPADKSITEYVGSGPFKFVNSEFRPGVRVVYDRHEGYVPRSEPLDFLAGGKVVKVDRVEWLSLPDMQTAVNALKKGEIDLIETMNADTISLLKGAQGVEIQRLASTNGPTLRFNWLQPPFDKVKARQAVQQVIMQRDFMDALVGEPDAYKVCGALFGCGTPLETNVGEIGTGDADPARAKALLRESGYKGETIVILNVGDTPSFSGLASITAQMLRSIGMNVDMQTMDFATMLTRRNGQGPVSEGGWNIAYGVWNTLDLASPISNLNLDTRGKAGYAGWCEDPEMDRLKKAYAAAIDVQKQKDIAAEIQKRAYELVFYIPLGTYYNFGGHRSNVSPMVPAPVSTYWGIEKS
jgi:peptide/nickel transport system substrate-binding protein